MDALYFIMIMACHDDNKINKLSINNNNDFNIGMQEKYVQK